MWRDQAQAWSWGQKPSGRFGPMAVDIRTRRSTVMPGASPRSNLEMALWLTLLFAATRR
jgi:hypothetical protein